MNNKKIRMGDPQWSANLWSRIKSLFTGLDTRVTALEQGGGGGGGAVSGVKGDAESTYRTGNVNLTPANIGAIPTTQKGAASGVAELDSGGKVPTAQLPSYVDDVLEYSSRSAFPSTGEAGKIYVALDTNLTYRWGGSDYVEISPSLALGETSSTAYRGDRGKAAYDHASANGSAFASGLYKITTNAEGHVTGATAAQKSDITALGIPGQDTTYSDATQSAAGLMSSTDKAKLDGIASGAQVNSITGVKGNSESSYRTGNVNLTAANVGAVDKSGDTMNGNLDFNSTNGTQKSINFNTDHGLFDIVTGADADTIFFAGMKKDESWVSRFHFNLNDNTTIFDAPIAFANSSIAATTRTNLGIVIELQGLTFSSGVATVANKSGYLLMSVIAVNRPDYEYSPIGISQQTDSSYKVVNLDSTLSGEMACKLLWVAS